MPVTVLSEPPSSVHSGIPLRKTYTVQHRSDQLLQEQVNDVKETQDSLRKILTELEVTRPDSGTVTELQDRVDKLRQQTEYQVLKLKILSKINAELNHARTDLEQALAGRGDIPACRKRVSWLEERMEGIVGKHRLRNHHTKLHGSQDVRSPPAIGPEVGLISEEVYSPEHLKEADSLPGSQQGHTTEVKDDREIVLENGVNGADQDGRQPETSSREHPADVQIIEDDDDNISAGGDRREEGTVPLMADDVERHIQSAPAGQALTDQEDYVAEQTGSLKDRATLVALHTDQNNSSETTGKDGSGRPDTKKSRVTVQSPKSREITLLGIGECIPFETSKSLEYWNSEHHRFEKSDASAVLCETDPLSYHQMALAVPGTFLGRSQSELTGLPWRPHRKGSDIQDIHKIALNKLASRVQNISDKVYNAAMLSVNSYQKGDRMFQKGIVKNSGGGQKPHSLPDLRPSSSEDVTVLPIIHKTRLGTSGSGRVAYHPNPIPPPQTLPLTRTNTQTEFPRNSSHFCEVENDHRIPAERIVDQHKLYEETKFSLYRERPRANLDGPSLTEKRLRKLLESDGTQTRNVSAKAPSSPEDPVEIMSPQDFAKKRRQKLRSHFHVAKAVAKLKGTDSPPSISSSSSGSKAARWTVLKPKSNSMDHSGLKWERVKTMVHTNLVSERAEERVDAARHLGLLRCGDAMVFFALKERLHKDEERRVRYEAAKALVIIGCWDQDVMEILLQYLVMGNMEIRADLINTMSKGKNLQYIDKTTSCFPELVKVLSHFCCNPDPEDTTSFEAALLLGQMCVADDNAKSRLKTALQQNRDTHLKAKALEILIKQMNCTEWDMVEELLELLRSSPVWKYRTLAARLLILLGRRYVCVKSEVEKVYDLLERRLWDDPITEVRLAVAKVITALDMFPRASESVEKKLEDPNEDIRSQAVISLGTLGMKSEKIIRLLLEMIELDSSEYVRIMIVRTLMTLNLTDRRVIRVLKEKERMDGLLAKEAKKALRVLCPPVPPSRVPQVA